ncbi:MAG TPA: hypothetical protein VJI13_01625, partial [Candidatus Norongarragalinales archaeon]|nr:hypothetical protein [Candidatus Norongarragalinales archaeon]
RAKGEDIYSHFSRWAKMHNINVRVSGGWIRAKRAILSNYVAENEAHRGEVTDAALLFLDLHPEYVKEGYYQKQTEHKGNITIKFRKINPG